MSGVLAVLPKIEGFQPIPNSVMVPFMETQSAALAYAFGLNYEFGKRKIKSMDNETFNSLTSEQIAEMSSQHTSVLLEQFIQKIPQTLLSQEKIFEQYALIEQKKMMVNAGLARWFALNAVDLARGTAGTGPDIITPIPSPTITPSGTVRSPSRPTTASTPRNPQPKEKVYTFEYKFQRVDGGFQSGIISLTLSLLKVKVKQMEGNLNTGSSIQTKARVRQLFGLRQAFQKKFGFWI